MGYSSSKLYYFCLELSCKIVDCLMALHVVNFPNGVK